MELQENQKIIEQIIPAPVSSEEDEVKDFELFRGNLELILENAKFIINTPELYYASFNGATINLAYMGGHQAPVGVLLELWNEGLLVDQCEKCNGSLYIFCAGGSPLSGQNKCSGICRNCKRVSKIELASIDPIIKALKHLKNNVNKKKVIRTKGQNFSWKDGIAGEPIPDKIVEGGVNPVNMMDLLERLKTKLD